MTDIDYFYENNIITFIQLKVLHTHTSQYESIMPKFYNFGLIFK